MTKRKHPKISLQHDVLQTTHSHRGGECQSLSETTECMTAGCDVSLLTQDGGCALAVLPEDGGSHIPGRDQFPVLRTGVGCAFPVSQPEVRCESSTNQSGTGCEFLPHQSEASCEFRANPLEEGCEFHACRTGGELPCNKSDNKFSGLNCDGAADMDVSGTFSDRFDHCYPVPNR
jgi:hypothetical protein